MKEANVRENQYITIMGWMRNIPEIETNTELMAYALIYGFSQTEGQYLTCRQSYIASWLGIGRQRCNEVLANLESKNLIKRILVREQGAIKIYKYCYLPPVNESQERRQDVSHNATRRVRKCDTYVSENATRYVSDNATHDNNIYNNNIYISNSNPRNGNNKFNHYEQHDYDFHQLELELPCNVTKE